MADGSRLFGRSPPFMFWVMTAARQILGMAQRHKCWVITSSWWEMLWSGTRASPELGLPGGITKAPADNFHCPTWLTIYTRSYWYMWPEKANILIWPFQAQKIPSPARSDWKFDRRMRPDDFAWQHDTNFNVLCQQFSSSYRCSIHCFPFWCPERAKDHKSLGLVKHQLFVVVVVLTSLGSIGFSA